jgi:hypothetical protein
VACIIIQANVITIVNYDRQTFIVQATGFEKSALHEPIDLTQYRDDASTISITTLSITTLSKMTLNKIGLFATFCTMTLSLTAL